MGAPCAAVPSPAGSHLPSRPISISQCAMSEAVTGFPRFGLGRCDVAAKTAATPQIQSTDAARVLSIGMFNHAMLIHCPACHRVDVMIFECQNRGHGLQHAAL